jgi:hypothetical protein
MKMTETVVKSDGTIIQTDEQVEAVNESLLKYPNYVGYCDGCPKIKDGEEVPGTKVRRIFVRRKLPKERLTTEQMIPELHAGIETDVVEIGDVVAESDPKDHYRPIPMGVSMGNIKITAGTAGGLVKKDGKIMVATNTHVACESVTRDLGMPGEPGSQDRRNCQPGPIDDGNLRVFGDVRYAFIMPPGQPAFNDFAIVEPYKVEDVIAETLNGKVVPDGMAMVEIGDTVYKEGRTTGYTEGQVTAIGANVNVGYSEGTILHKNCIITTDMSAGGDSGSWVYKKGTKKVTMYLFAGSSVATVHHPIQDACSAMSCQVYTEESPVNPDEIEHNVILEREDNGSSFRLFGVVEEEKAGGRAAVPDVDIILCTDDKEWLGSTNSDGFYEFVEIPYGNTYTINFGKDGYKLKTDELGLIEK